MVTTRQNFTVLGDTLNEIQEFTNLGSELLYNCDLTSEVQKRVKLASGAFDRLSVKSYQIKSNVTLIWVVMTQPGIK